MGWKVSISVCGLKFCSILNLVYEARVACREVALTALVEHRLDLSDCGIWLDLQKNSTINKVEGHVHTYTHTQTHEGTDNNPVFHS